MPSTVGTEPLPAAQIIVDYYRGDDALKRKASSVMLESLPRLLPAHVLSSRGKLTNNVQIRP